MTDESMEDRLRRMEETPKEIRTEESSRQLSSLKQMLTLQPTLKVPGDVGTPELRINHRSYGRIPVFRVSTGKDTGKSEIAVGKILAMHCRGVSDTTYRLEETPLYKRGIVERKAQIIADAYQKIIPFASLDTIVLGSAHRLGVYLARAMDSLFLPIQFLAFMEKWEDLASVEVPAVAGSDFDADPLIYAWLRPTELPDAYKKLLQDSQNLVVVRSTDKDRAVPVGQHYLHSSAFTTKLGFKAPRVQEGYLPEKIPHWEWGLSDKTVEALRTYSMQHGKNFTLIEGSTNALYRLVVDVVQRLYDKNGVQPEKFVFNSYWIAHPYYEIETLSLPICAARLYTPETCDWIGKLQKKTGISNADVFVNNFGGDEIAVLKHYLISSGYFNVQRFAVGADDCGTDSWDEEHSSSRQIAEALQTIEPRIWRFLSYRDLADLAEKQLRKE